MRDDGYDVIVFKILAYYYAVMQRKIIYEGITFGHVVGEDLNREYISDVLYSMKKSGLVENVRFKSAPRGSYIPKTDLSEMRITPKGIRHLTYDAHMAEIRKYFFNRGGMTSALVAMLFDR